MQMIAPAVQAKCMLQHYAMWCSVSHAAESRRRKRKQELKSDKADQQAEEAERAAARQKREEEAQLRADGQSAAMHALSVIHILSPCLCKDILCMQNLCSIFMAVQCCSMLSCICLPSRFMGMSGISFC